MRTRPVPVVKLENRLDAHFVSAIAVLVEHVGSEGVHAERDGIVVTAMGRGGDEFNMGTVTGPMRAPDESLTWACETLERSGRPWMLQVPEALHDDGLQATLRTSDLELAQVLPGMIREVPAEVPSLPTGLRIEQVEDQALLDAHSLTTAANFGAPDPRASLGMFPASLMDDPRVVMLNGYLDDRPEPVATAVSVMNDGLAGVYSITAHPDVRRRGIGAAMTWAAIQAGARKGADLAVLQATPLGRPVYEGMGFRAVREYLRFTRAGRRSSGHAVLA